MAAQQACPGSREEVVDPKAKAAESVPMPAGARRARAAGSTTRFSARWIASARYRFGSRE